MNVVGNHSLVKGFETNNTSIACIQCKIQDWMVHVLL